MDDRYFDAFVIALSRLGSRRRALRGLLVGALGVVDFASREDALGHNILRKCKNRPRGKKRKKCVRKGRKHRKWHKRHDGPTRHDEPACRGDLYTARYFDNDALIGTPVLVRCENWPISHDWGTGSPGSAVPNNHFSARWTGRSSIAEGDYDLIARGDDGVRVWFGSQLVIDRWSGALPETRVRAHIQGGTYDLRIEFRELSGGAVVFFRWDHATCDGTQSFCSSSSQCCGSLVCREDFCFTGNVCCAQTGQACGETCDCCDDDLCGGDGRCYDPGTLRDGATTTEKKATEPRREPLEIRN